MEEEETRSGEACDEEFSSKSRHFGQRTRRTRVSCTGIRFLIQLNAAAKVGDTVTAAAVLLRWIATPPVPSFVSPAAR